MMPSGRALEPWARQVVSETLGVDVEVNDDGSANSLVDLRVGPADHPTLAIEVTTSVSQQRMSQISGLDRGGHVIDAPSLFGTWVLVLQVHAQLRKLRPDVVSLLRRMEHKYGPGKCDSDLWESTDAADLDSLGILHASLTTPGTVGRVLLLQNGVGGRIESSGEEAVLWVGEFCNSLDRSDNRTKLAASRAPQRHLFVAVHFGGAPWSVEGYLTDWLANDGGPSKHVPARAPDLPKEITHVWLVSTTALTGIRWTGETWQRFNAPPSARPGIDRLRHPRPQARRRNH